jgi:hypothetical protein
MRLGRYKHFKGTVVDVIGIALHSETQEEMVIYNHPDPIKGKDANTMWARPKEMFLDNVRRENYDGPRFKKIKEN